MVNENVDNQFIFREVEFEDDKFHAASFVAKYRRVTSLESLRDQLRLYCDALKQQLYGIINRDYKDFITIATKVKQMLSLSRTAVSLVCLTVIANMIAPFASTRHYSYLT